MPTPPPFDLTDPLGRLVAADWLEEHDRQTEADRLRATGPVVVTGGRVMEAGAYGSDKGLRDRYVEARFESLGFPRGVGGGVQGVVMSRNIYQDRVSLSWGGWRWEGPLSRLEVVLETWDGEPTANALFGRLAAEDE